MKNLLTFVGALAVLLSTQVARAQSTWVPVSGSNSWSVSGNWSGGIPNAQTAVANVKSALTANSTITLGGVVTVGTLNLGATSGNFGFSIAPGTGGGLTLDNGGSGAVIAEASFNSGDTISSAISMADTNATTALTITSGDVSGKTFLISGGITSTAAGSNLVIDANSAGAINFTINAINNQGTITNSGSGAGTVTIAGGVGSNVTSITESGSTSPLTISGALATTGTGITLKSTATGGTAQFQITGGITGSGSLVINNTGSESSATGAIYINTGAVTTTGTISNVGSGTGVSIASAITSASAVIQDGTSSLILGGANTYAGNTTLQLGTLVINNATSLGTGTLIINGGTLDSTGAGVTMTNNNAQTWNSSFAWNGTKFLTFGTGAITLGNNVTITAASRGSTLTENGAISGTGTLTFVDNVSGTVFVFNGAINNSGAIINSGSSTGGTVINGNIGSNVGLITQSGANAYLTLGGTNTNANGVALVSGTLNLNSATALGATASTLTITSGTLDNKSGASLTLANNNAQNWNGSFTFAGTSSLNLGTGAVTLGATPTVTVTANTLTEGGVISGSSGLTKAGAGTLVLSGLSTYTGVTTVSAGILSINSIADANGGGASALGDPTAGNSTIVLGGGTLQYTGSSLGSSNRAISLTGTSTLDASGSATFALSGGVTGTNRGLILQGSGAGSESGAIATGTGSVTKAGSGVWTLSGANTYTGGTLVSSGTLVINGSIANTSSVSVQSGATLAGTGTIHATGNATIAGAIKVGNGGTTDVLTMSVGGAANFSAASLTFNLDSVIQGNSSTLALGSTPSAVFGSTALTLNLVGSSPISNNTDYILFTSTATSDIFTGLTLSGSIITSGLNVTFTGANASDYSGSYLMLVSNGLGGDNIEEVIVTSAVPEPGTWALMLGGLALLVVCQRVRRNKNV